MGLDARAAEVVHPSQNCHSPRRVLVYIPAEYLGGLGGAKRQRRGSAVESVLESVQESVRRMSVGEEESSEDVT